MRQTHTYAILHLSQAAWDEIDLKLREADYYHAFHEDHIIDMQGIAVQPEANASVKDRDDAHWMNKVKATTSLDELAVVLQDWLKALHLAQGYAQRHHEVTP